MISLPVITDLRSGDLTADCMHERALVRQGKYDPHMPEAMYRGNFIGKACQFLIESNEWSEDGCAGALQYATIEVQADLVKENRMLTDAVIANRERIHKDIGERVFEFARRFGPRFKACKLIGCELPIRWTLEHESLSEPIEFGSHLDVLLRDTRDVWGRGEGRLVWIDFKDRKDSPTFGYIARNGQFILYQLSLWEGQVQVDKDGPEDEGWTQFGEWAAAAWFHLPNLHVYKKATKGKDEDGNPITYAKGDSRPLSAIVKWANFRKDRADDMKTALAERARMFQLGIYPMNPGPVTCFLCSSQDWCDRFDTGATP